MEPAHICTKCGKSFDNNKKLTAHFQYHKDDEILECNLCQKKYTSKLKMRDHIRKVHGGKKNCPQCPYEGLPANLKRHMDDVHEEKSKNSCVYCGKTIKQLSYLKIHELCLVLNEIMSLITIK